MQFSLAEMSETVSVQMDFWLSHDSFLEGPALLASFFVLRSVLSFFAQPQGGLGRHLGKRQTRGSNAQKRLPSILFGAREGVETNPP